MLKERTQKDGIELPQCHSGEDVASWKESWVWVFFVCLALQNVL